MTRFPEYLEKQERKKKNKYREQCDCCKNVVVAYTKTLTLTHIKWLIKYQRHYQSEQKRTWEKIIKSIKVSRIMNHRETAAFQQLRYFGLIEKTEDWRQRNHRTIPFLNWTLAVFDKVATFKNERVKRKWEIRNAKFPNEKDQPNLVKISDIINDDKYWSSQEKKDYQDQRPTYDELWLTLFAE